MTTAPRALSPSVNGWNAPYLDDQYDLYKRDPAQVSPDLRAFFQGFELAQAGGGPARRPADTQADAPAFQQRVDALVNAYRASGHLAAAIDPFGRPRHRPATLNPEHYGFTPQDMQRPVSRGDLRFPEVSTLGRLIESLEQTYTRSIAFEFMHVQDHAQRSWLLDRIEGSLGRPTLQPEDRRHILEQLIRAEEFENFLQRRYPGDKRFSIEGGESTIPLLDRLIEAAGNLGVEEMVLGMAHRGRLNVLNNIMGKTYEQIFTEFEYTYADDEQPGGDVKYHKGYSGLRRTRSGRDVHLAMADPRQWPAVRAGDLFVRRHQARELRPRLRPQLRQRRPFGPGVLARRMAADRPAAALFRRRA
ncbi:hypothetical protein J4558_15970 [Leptolyngbya sp. 15MV]|nr:hypothetical protein J4558_15970 [Leptolyngbya sp. 15MV]